MPLMFCQQTSISIKVYIPLACTGEKNCMSYFRNEHNTESKACSVIWTLPVTPRAKVSRQLKLLFMVDKCCKSSHH